MFPSPKSILHLHPRAAVRPGGDFDGVFQIVFSVFPKDLGLYGFFNLNITVSGNQVTLKFCVQSDFSDCNCFLTIGGDFGQICFCLHREVTVDDIVCFCLLIGYPLLFKLDHDILPCNLKSANRLVMIVENGTILGRNSEKVRQGIGELAVRFQ